MKSLKIIVICLLMCMQFYYRGVRGEDYSTPEDSMKAVISIYDHDYPTKRKGTGFVIDENGIIVTSYHEIVAMDTPFVYVREKNMDYEVKGIVGYDSKRDICIIKIDAERLNCINISEYSNIHIGGDIFVPSNIAGKIFSGNLSGLDEAFFDFFLLAINIGGLKPGDSGAPVLDTTGNLVGMILMARTIGNMKFLAGQEEAIGVFAIGVNEIKEVYEKATSILTLEKFKELNQSDPYYFLEMANYYAVRSKYDVAISNALKAIILDKENFEAYRVLGDCYQKLGQFYKAIEYYDRTIDIKPTSLGATFGLAGTYSTLKNFDKAITYYKKCIELQPDTYGFYWGLGYSYASKGDYNEAQEAYAMAAKYNPNSPQVYYSLGLMYLKLSNIKMAKESFQNAIKLYRKQGQIDEAQKLEQFINSL